MTAATTRPTIEDVLDRLQGVRRERDGQWQARCPAHDDLNPSLSIGIGDDGKMLLRCQAGCEFKAVVAAMGLQPSDLFPTRSNGNGRARKSLARVVATYGYANAQGDVLYEVVRFAPKTFRPRRPDGNGGWKWDLRGTPRILYNLREIIDADPTDRVFIVEGERDADNLAKLGLVATCNAGGAGKWHTLSDDSVLDRRRIAVIPDADEPGRKHAADVAQQLHGRAADVRIVELPGDGKDVSDWLVGGGTRDELLRLVEAAPVFRPGITSVTNATPTTTSRTFNLTDLGNAERLVAAHGNDIRYADGMGFLVWTNTHWERDTRGAVERFAAQTIRNTYTEAATLDDLDGRQKLVQWAIKSESRARLADMVKLAESRPEVRASVDDLDGDPWLLNAKNGTLDLRTGDLREHNRDDLVTRCVPVAYDANAEAPRWEQFLDEIMDGQADMIEFLQRAIGHSLTGDTSERCLFMLWGTGRNGKSTLLYTIRELLGDYAIHARAETILAKRGDAIPCDLARLKGARFLTVTELEDGRRMDVARVKEMTGGTDPITARFMRQNEFSFMPQFKPWIGTNHKPAIRDDTDSIWDRVFTIPFAVRVTNVDKQLPDRLRDELPGILRWAVEGCLAWQQAGGLDAPEAVLAANREYRTEQDTFAQWMDECCVVDDLTMRATSGDLWESHKAWADRMKVRSMSSRRFGERLTARFEKKPINGRITYFGLGLRTTP